ncbi:MAG: hypothetical protein IBJ14_11740 [Hydrogenophaga sp.]|nr:hypothetical protein [Hydrogenophaga sp.]
MTWLRQLIDSLTEPKALRLARNKRDLERICRECGVSVAKARAIASRYFKEVAR